MSASSLTALRASLTAFHGGSCRWLLGRLTPILCHRLRLHVSPTAGLSSSRTEPTRSSDVADKVADKLGQEEPECPEYIPRRKAKNPMMKLGYAWMIGLPAGIIGFILAKRQVDKNRLKQLKVRQRMKRSNEGEYDGSRYRQHAKLDR
ncbi:uncharacterized protein LOC106699773 [Xiphophorus maculatus]|uniref:uncharacterized protein LOC106699773 n=1 Tax=Xiphophorus maculatus TaxID=8083 RepID=UPI0002939BE8|nr:uncharacterized protein LOC106699773 [Xiphophorus maculatus]